MSMSKISYKKTKKFEPSEGRCVIPAHQVTWGWGERKLTLPQKKIMMWDWRDGSVVKGTGCSSRRPRFPNSHKADGSQQFH